MKKHTSSSATLITLVDTLAHVEVSTPSGRNLADVIASTASGEQFAHRFALGDPDAELLARVDEIQKTDQLDHIKTLVSQLGSKRTWDALSRYEGRYHAGTDAEKWMIRRLIVDGVLPDGDAIFTDGADHPDILDHVLARRVGCASFTADLLARHLVSRNQDASALLSSLNRNRQELTTACLFDTVVPYVAAKMSGGEQVNVSDGWILTSDQIGALIADGTDAALVVAARSGMLSHSDTAALAQTGAGQALLLDNQRPYVAVDVDQLRFDLLSPDGAAHLLARHRVDNTRDLVRALELSSQGARIWILGELHENRPTLDGVRAALAAGVLDASDVFVALPTALRIRAEWVAAAAEVPGLVAYLLNEMASLGAIVNGASDWSRGKFAAVLQVIAEKFGDDDRLWERFVTAGDKSPFHNETLSLNDIVELYQTRWAEAEGRRTGSRR